MKTVSRAFFKRRDVWRLKYQLVVWRHRNSFPCFFQTSPRLTFKISVDFLIHVVITQFMFLAEYPYKRNAQGFPWKVGVRACAIVRDQRWIYFTQKWIEMFYSTNQSHHWILNQWDGRIQCSATNQNRVTSFTSASEQYIQWQNRHWYSGFFDRPWWCSPVRNAAKYLLRREA
jgi:hypothetical protein